MKWELRSDMPLPEVHVVILNWNGWQDTLKCLESVRRLDYSNCRIIVVDNGSEDDSWLRLSAIPGAHCMRYQSTMAGGAYKKYEAVLEDGICTVNTRAGIGSLETCTLTGLEEGAVTFVGVNENLGFAGGCNVGIAYALRRGADYVFLLNNDARIAPEAMSHMINVADEADAAIVGAQVLDERGSKVLFNRNLWPACLFGIRGTLPNSCCSDVFWPSPGGVNGAAILLRRDLLQQRLGEYGCFLDPEFFMYVEETDLCIYGRTRGYSCMVSCEAIVYHGLAKSSGGSANPRSYYYLTRNRIYLAERWLKLPWRFLFHLYYAPSRLALRLLRIGRERRGVSAAVFSGLLDGYRGVTGKWRHHGGRDG